MIKAEMTTIIYLLVEVGRYLLPFVLQNLSNFDVAWIWFKIDPIRIDFWPTAQPEISNQDNQSGPDSTQR